MYASVKFFNEDCKTVKNRGFTFKTLITTLQPGDMVVVETRFGPAVAQFSSYVEKPYSQEYTRDIVGVVDNSKHKMIEQTMSEFKGE